MQGGCRVIVNFHAPWAAPCVQMNLVFAELHAKHADLRFATAAAETLADVTSSYNISTVPTFLLFADSHLVRRRVGADAQGLCGDAEWLSQASESQLKAAMCEMVARKAEITVVMKGNVERPRCGFSRQVVEVLRKEGVVFETFDVLEDGLIREEMKKWAEWPTFPMVFARGRLVGGVDIVRDLADGGRLIEELESEGGGVAVVKKKEKMVEGEEKEDGKEGLRRRMEELTRKAGVVVFMKGSEEAPRCGFSRRVVEVLKREGVDFWSFDILQDEQVRAGLKWFSEWPTFPQVYAGGRFVGGLDVVTQLVEAGELKRELGLET